MHITSGMNDGSAHDLRRPLRWLEYFFFLLFVTPAVWYAFKWRAVLPGAVTVLVVGEIDPYIPGGRLVR
jgi:hypothetical protein